MQTKGHRSLWFSGSNNNLTKKRTNPRSNSHKDHQSLCILHRKIQLSCSRKEDHSTVDHDHSQELASQSRAHRH
ncbi:hypothetical protein L1887_06495 [Cichorium endivia]|nr:hypothetical protein L1887_06495 [Cichorium endivia]